MSAVFVCRERKAVSSPGAHRFCMCQTRRTAVTGLYEKASYGTALCIALFFRSRKVAASRCPGPAPMVLLRFPCAAGLTKCCSLCSTQPGRSLVLPHGSGDVAWLLLGRPYRQGACGKGLVCKIWEWQDVATPAPVYQGQSCGPPAPVFRLKLNPFCSSDQCFVHVSCFNPYRILELLQQCYEPFIQLNSQDSVLLNRLFPLRA